MTESDSRDAPDAATSAEDGEGPGDELIELLAVRTEAGRLERARDLASGVDFQLADPELVLATVASYNVVIDVVHRRVVHACRDFRSQAPAGMLCKHVAAVLISMEPELAMPVARGLADAGGGWRLENIRRFK